MISVQFGGRQVNHPKKGDKYSGAKNRIFQQNSKGVTSGDLEIQFIMEEIMGWQDNILIFPTCGNCLQNSFKFGVLLLGGPSFKGVM